MCNHYGTIGLLNHPLYSFKYASAFQKLVLTTIQANYLTCRRGEDPGLSALIALKLATEYYEFDATRSHSPPLQPRYVNSKPSPDPIFLPPPASVPSPRSNSSSPRPRGRKNRRHRRTQPSQGDAVLIDILANQNRPDVAAIAGERPLDIDSGCSDEDMGEGDQDVIQIAQFASRLADVNESSADESEDQHVLDVRTRPRPKIDTNTLRSKGEILGVKEQTQLKQKVIYTGKQVGWGVKEVKVTLDERTVPKDDLIKSSDPFSNYKPRSDNSLVAKPSATSSNLRQYAIPISEGSPMETLPAMQSSPPQCSRSPMGQQNLPSLHVQLGSLADPRPLQESSARPNGIALQALPPYPMTNGSVQSSPKDLGLSRMGQFPSISNRTNGHLAQCRPIAQPSPASTLSEPSPRDHYVKTQEPASMSSPGRFNSHFGNGPTPQSDVQTPISADSCPSTSSFSTNTSPNGDRTNNEDSQPTFPPPSANGPADNIGFKCDFIGCTATPFQTQYLLK